MSKSEKQNKMKWHKTTEKEFDLAMILWGYVGVIVQAFIAIKLGWVPV